MNGLISSLSMHWISKCWNMRVGCLLKHCLKMSSDSFMQRMDIVMDMWRWPFGFFFFILLYPLFLIHGFKQQYPRMSLEWILDKPLALGLGPHPHLSGARSPSLSLSLKHTHTHTHTHIQGLQKHYRHSANLIKRDFVMCISPTASWPEWQQCGWVEKQEEDRQTIGSSSGQQIGLCVCVYVCVSACACLHVCVYIEHMC